ncbi:MAG: imidazole glycerol phosphate synthase subunit HisH [Coxiellaceae bacterium]|nr:imidazole glycerol phosphate synthase subunit HisH [Coxiellaceae bacterium]
MNKPIIGVINYGAGNCSSVKRMLSKLGYRCRIIRSIEEFIDVKILLIPGVGAFASAMKSLHKLHLLKPILEFAYQGFPIIGICLGMQLLAEASYEHTYVRGLGLIAGEVQPISKPLWHVGWNTLEVVGKDSMVQGSHGEHFYFNHSFEFNAVEHVIGISKVKQHAIVSIVKKDNIYGFQFHPEISQDAGLKLMNKVIAKLCCSSELLCDA